MKVGITVLASAFLLAAAPAVLAQNPNDDPLLAAAQSGIAKLADSEWQKLPQTELNCVGQRLGERGESVQSLAQRGVLPGDPAVVDVRSQCRASSTPAARDQTPAQAKYAVDGLALGTQVKPDSAAYRDYKCGASQQFDGFTWCQKTRNEKERKGPFTASYSILHAQDGRIAYVNRHQAPAFFVRKAADEEIQRYSRSIGESPRITTPPHRNNVPDAVLATWGKIVLEPLDQDSIKILAEGKSPKKGLLIDYLGNFARSAKEGLPIYRITGGPGLLWAASFDRAGRGTLRIVVADTSGLSASLPDQAPNVSASTPQPVITPAPTETKVEVADAVGTLPQVDSEKPETTRQVRLDTVNADQQIEPPKGTQDGLDDLLLAQEPRKITPDVRNPARGIPVVGLIVLFVIAGLWQLMKSRKRAKDRDQLPDAPVASLVPQIASPETSAERQHAGDKQADSPNRVSKTQPVIALSNLPAAVSESVVPEVMAQRPGEQNEKNKPGGNFDEGELVNHLAETLGVQEQAGSLPRIARTPSEPVIAESASGGVPASP